MKMIKLLPGLFLMLGAIGCSGGAVGSTDRPETAPVTVTITYKSAPVAGATVTFSPQKAEHGSAAYGKTDDSGKVNLNTFPDVKGVVPGEYKVLVVKMEAAAGQGIPMDDPNYDGGENAAPTGPPKSLIPTKYNAAATSDLKAEVKAGQDNPFTFDLVD